MQLTCWQTGGGTHTEFFNWVRVDTLLTSLLTVPLRPPPPTHTLLVLLAWGTFESGLTGRKPLPLPPHWAPGGPAGQRERDWANTSTVNGSQRKCFGYRATEANGHHSVRSPWTACDSRSGGHHACRRERGAVWHVGEGHWHLSSIDIHQY